MARSLEHGTALGGALEADRLRITRVTRLTRATAALFLVVIGGLTIANLALQLPAMDGTYQNGLSQTFAQRCRFRAQELLSAVYLLELCANGSLVAGNAAFLVQPTLASTALSMNTSVAFLGIIYNALQVGNATLNLTEPLTNPTIAAAYAAITPALRFISAAVGAIATELRATNASAISPTVASNLSVILVQQPLFLAGIVNVSSEMTLITQSELQTITTREIAINVATLIALVLLGALVYIPMERRIWLLASALLERNIELNEMAANLAILARLNPNGIVRTDALGRIIYANERWFAITGIKALGKAADAWMDRILPDDAATARAAWGRTLHEPGATFDLEFRFASADGTVRWFLVQSVQEMMPMASTMAHTSPSKAANGVASAGIPLLEVGHTTTASGASPASAVTWGNSGSGTGLNHGPVSKADVVSLVTAFTDVTEERTLAQERVTALSAAAALQTQRADDADRHRRELERFIDVICHEIRNPLNGVVNNVDLLRTNLERLRADLGLRVATTTTTSRDTSAPPMPRLDVPPATTGAVLSESMAMLDAIDVCALHQRRITDDVLEVSRLHAGRYTLEHRAFWLDQLVDGVLAMFSAEADGAGIVLNWNEASRACTHVSVRTDPQRVSQILINLVSNAVKFSRHASVRRVGLDIEVRRGDDQNGDTIVLAVRDTGIGMTAEEQSRLFVPFGQASSKTYSDYGGSGMGLFIVKELLDLMGGSVTIVSTLGAGSTFLVHIPCQLGAGEAAAPAAADQGQPTVVAGGALIATATLSAGDGAAATRILVVDDNEINRVVLTRQLRALPSDAGVSVVTAINGLDAVRLTEATPVEIIIMDIEMPVLNGLEATAQIRAHERELSLTPAVIVGLSGNARPEHRDQALAAGMDDYVIKPYDKVVFLALLFRLLRERRLGVT